MQIELPQELADTIASRFGGVSVEEYVVRTIRESIDGETAERPPRLRSDSPLRAMALKAKADVRARRTIPLP